MSFKRGLLKPIMLKILSVHWRKKYRARNVTCKRKRLLEEHACHQIPALLITFQCPRRAQLYKRDTNKTLWGKTFLCRSLHFPWLFKHPWDRQCLKIRSIGCRWHFSNSRVSCWEVATFYSQSLFLTSPARSPAVGLGVWQQGSATLT